MERKGKSVSRNWEFSHNGGESVAQHISGVSLPEHNDSGHKGAFLRMGTYSDKNQMIIQSSSGILMMNYPCERNFLSETRSMTDSRSTQINAEMIETPSAIIASEKRREVCEAEPKSSKVKKQQSSTKGNNISSKVLRQKEPKQQTSTPKKKKETSTSTGIREKKSQDTIEDGEIFDISSMPAPVCTCTGIPHQCYRWGAGGWQSSCCTIKISEYPLPMSTSRPGARLAGRKMSVSAYRKLLHKLANEGHDLSSPVDLKNHWARHGTNKFVTIR